MFGVTWLIWLITVAFQAFLAILLSRRLGLGTGLAAYSLLMLAFAGLGWFLLGQLTTDSINWRNRVVSILMPWPAIVGGGSLQAFVLKNAIASIVFALLVVGCDHFKILSLNRTASGLGDERLGSQVLAWATIVCWIVLATAWLWLLRSSLANQPDTISVLLSLRGVTIPLLVPPITVISSLVLHHKGHAIASFLTVAVPLVVVLTPVMLMLAVIIFHYVTGKPMRWN